jgi:hypothetical protein
MTIIIIKNNIGASQARLTHETCDMAHEIEIIP